MAQRMKLPARLRSVLRIRRRRLVVAVVLAAGVGGWFWSLLPRALFDDPLSYVAEARDGTLLSARIAADGQWRFPPAATVPHKFRRALIVYEDKRFEDHVGIDPLAVARAMRLNAQRGPGSALFDTLAKLIKRGVADGWAANIEIDGPLYRRSRLLEPSARTHHFSITAVYMDSRGNTQGNPEGCYRGQYHARPYGEFNMVIPVTPGAALAGPNGWCEAGWTAPPPGAVC